MTLKKVCSNIRYMLLGLKNVTKSFKDNVVLSHADFSVEEGDRIGVVGVNGAGKTTLLDILYGGDFDVDPKNGESARYVKKDIKIGYLRQVERLDGSLSLYVEIRSSFKNVDETAIRIRDYQQKILSLEENSPQYKSIAAELNKQTAYYESIDGYNVETNIKKVLYGMGFADKDLSCGVDKLSGGEKTRFAMAKLLCLNPDVLLLDEPTNHLDFVTRDWLEKYLADFKGAIVVVSHDRYFLDKITNKITEVRNGELHSYNGGYKKFLVLRQSELDLQRKQYEKQQEEISKMEEFVRKNLAASASTNSVGSRVKALEKMERIKKVAPPPKDFVVNFDFDQEPVKDVLTVKKFSLKLGDKQLFDNVAFSVTRGDKVAFVGLNGAGKTSFLRAILREIPFFGSVNWGGGVKTAYFAQENQNLNLNRTVYDEVCDKMPLASQYDVRSLLARVQLTDDGVFKKIGELSGATRSKVQFALLMRQRANVLVLDEPTNHLDFKGLEGLDNALSDFKGTLLLVTHDRYLLKKVPNRIAEIRDGGIFVYEGNYDDYLKAKEKEKAANKPSDDGERQRLQSVKQNVNKKQARADKATKNNLEKEIAAKEREIENLNNQMLAPDVLVDYKKYAEIKSLADKADAELNALMEKWLEYA